MLSELEDEKRKHAQDTAQGDDVTYLLEKERERLNKEIEFEKSQSRKMEKDLKKANQVLEQERQKQKQIVLLLLAERKRIMLKLLEERQNSEQLSMVILALSLFLCGHCIIIKGYSSNMVLFFLSL